MKIGNIEISTKIFVATIIAYAVSFALAYNNGTDKGWALFALLIPFGAVVGIVFRNEKNAYFSMVLGAVIVFLATMFLSTLPIKDSYLFLQGSLFLMLYTVMACTCCAISRRFHWAWAVLCFLVLFFVLTFPFVGWGNIL